MAELPLGDPKELRWKPVDSGVTERPFRREHQLLCNWPPSCTDGGVLPSYFPAIRTPI
jgi:hypothetical protein